MLKMTYDIVNAGPRNRFCINGRIVHNSGRGAQPQNLKNSGPDVQACPHCGAVASAKNCPDCNSATDQQEWDHNAVEFALRQARTGLGLDNFERYFSDPVSTIASCIRGLLTAKPGHDLICSDYSAIEAVVLAAVAGEEWRLEVFRTHGKIYEMSASKISGVPFEEILDHKKRTGSHHPLRKKIGKIAELGCFGEDTEILTDSGWKPIIYVTRKDKIHDGIEYVEHGGVVSKGIKRIIDFAGIKVTPEHKFYLSDQRWETAVSLKYIKNYRQKALQTASHISAPVKFIPHKKTHDYLRVFDIINCGPRSRFVINTEYGPLIAHNSGYGGWVNAWKNFGAGKLMSDDEIKTNILKWREDSPAIVELWGGQWRKTPGEWDFSPEYYGLEGCAIQAILNPGYRYPYRCVSYYYDQSRDVLMCQLPSGRYLYYHSPRLTHDKDQRGLSIWAINFRGGKGFTWAQTYGSKLTENIIQAISRDILTAAMLRLEHAGYPIVLHVHDEIVSEIPKDFGDIKEFEKLMMVKESWFSDWPIKASGGWRGKRYRK